MFWHVARFQHVALVIFVIFFFIFFLEIIIDRQTAVIMTWEHPQWRRVTFGQSACAKMRKPNGLII
jgi:hypothetical protein